MFEKTRNVARKYAAKAGGFALAAPVMLLGNAHAQSTDPIGQMLDSIDLSGATVKIVAVGLLIVGIALAFKAPDLGKRAVRKV